jgi:hypothetical protein
MGGTSGDRAEALNTPPNGLALCRWCHDETEHHETWELTVGLGWKIPTLFVANPLEVPALIHTVNGYAWWRLTTDGGYRWIDLEVSHRLNCEPG